MRGTISVPVNVSMAWETMTFGYAYRINRYLTMALNLHRHTFVMDLRGKIDVDLLGKLNYKNDDGKIAIERELDHPASKVSDIPGHYEAEVWSPTIGLRAWEVLSGIQVRIVYQSKRQLFSQIFCAFLY